MNTWMNNAEQGGDAIVSNNERNNINNNPAEERSTASSPCLHQYKESDLWSFLYAHTRPISEKDMVNWLSNGFQGYNHPLLPLTFTESSERSKAILSNVRNGKLVVMIPKDEAYFCVEEAGKARKQEGGIGGRDSGRPRKPGKVARMRAKFNRRVIHACSNGKRVPILFLEDSRVNTDRLKEMWGGVAAVQAVLVRHYQPEWGSMFGSFVAASQAMRGAVQSVMKKKGRGSTGKATKSDDGDDDAEINDLALPIGTAAAADVAGRKRVRRPSSPSNEHMPDDSGPFSKRSRQPSGSVLMSVSAQETGAEEVTNSASSNGPFASGQVESALAAGSLTAFATTTIGFEEEIALMEWILQYLTKRQISVRRELEDAREQHQRVDGSARELEARVSALEMQHDKRAAFRGKLEASLTKSQNSLAKILERDDDDELSTLEGILEAGRRDEKEQQRQEEEQRQQDAADAVMPDD